MINSRTAPYAAFILRVTLGLLFLLHSGLKIFIFTPAGTAQFFASIGLPEFVAYVVIIAEVLVGLALILGVWTSFAALIIIPDLLGTIVWVHGAAGFFFSNPNGGWEFPAFWIVALLVQAMLGDGAYAMRPFPIPEPTKAN